MTSGIVSAQGRDIGSGPYDDFMQIDAAVNRGNSGGPTFNMAGQVVGVNTAIYSPSGGSVGIAFAIPASTVKDGRRPDQGPRICGARLDRRAGSARHQRDRGKPRPEGRGRRAGLGHRAQRSRRQGRPQGRRRGDLHQRQRREGLPRPGPQDRAASPRTLRSRSPTSATARRRRPASRSASCGTRPPAAASAPQPGPSEASKRAGSASRWRRPRG